METSEGGAPPRAGLDRGNGLDGGGDGGKAAEVGAEVRNRSEGS